MADAQVRIQYLPVTFTVQPGVPAANPTKLTVPLGVSVLLDFELLIPPGHAGTTGFALEMEGQKIVPFGGVNDWIIGDNERIRFDTNLEVGRQVRLCGFNVGVFAHTWYLLLHVDLTPQARAGGGVLLVPA